MKHYELSLCQNRGRYGYCMASDTSKLHPILQYKMEQLKHLCLDCIIYDFFCGGTRYLDLTDQPDHLRLQGLR